MRSTITVDDNLFEKAAEIVGDDNVSTVFRVALEALVAAEARKRLLRLSGKAPTFSVASRDTRMVAEPGVTYGRKENT